MNLIAKLFVSCLCIMTTSRAYCAEPPVAETPPMGWNSWDCYGASVREDEVRANADYMAKNLKKFGWKYVVVDIQWYEPTADSANYHPNAKLEMDEYGRLVPASNRFPSAAGGKGFKPLAEYIHGLGLKFGIHVMRGIPRQAVTQKTPILGTSFTAADVADPVHVCAWNTDMYGVDATKPGSQAWYDSNLKLYAEWGVDFIKVDDLSQPYSAGEIEEIHNAIASCGRPIVFSTSPGPTPFEQGAHIAKNANMWRVSGDFWDKWSNLNEAFFHATEWEEFRGAGHWPDLDMLPLGRIGIRSVDGDRRTRFTVDEQRTLISLWCMARSPLMFGGNLPDNDPATLALLTNMDVLDILNKSFENRQVRRKNDTIEWVASAMKGGVYVALFNLTTDPTKMEFKFADVGLPGKQMLKDLWSGATSAEGQAIGVIVPAHGVRLFWVHAKPEKKRSTLGNIILGPKGVDPTSPK